MTLPIGMEKDTLEAWRMMIDDEFSLARRRVSAAELEDDNCGRTKRRAYGLYGQ